MTTIATRLRRASAARAWAYGLDRFPTSPMAATIYRDLLNHAAMVPFGSHRKLRAGAEQQAAMVERVILGKPVTVLSGQVLEVTTKGGKTTARAVPDGLTKPKRP